MRKLTYFIIISSFILFSFYIFEKEKTFEVLEVYSSDKIGVDFNRNKQIDDNEVITIKLISPNINNDEERFIYEYFTKDYAKNLLEHNEVKLNKEKNNLIINNQSYADMFNNHDFSYIKNKNYRILNLKSNKYHYINCKYGRQSKDYLILPKSQLPTDAAECNFCKHKQHKLPVLYKTYLDKGEIKFFITDFTKKLKPDSKCSTELCQEIKTQINNSKNNIDIALYGYGDVPEITEAISKALKRGVKIRLVYDLDSKGENYYTDTKLLVNLIKDSQADNITKSISANLMHNKFFIFDNKTVITGSANVSATDMSGFNSNSAILISSPKTAEIYEKEFEQMYNGKFHNQKISNTKPQKINIGKSYISVYFSPQDKPVNNQVIPIINASKKSILIPTFLITHKELVDALISAKKRGVDIKIIVDATNASNKHSSHELLRKNGILVKTENFAGKMHSKSIIVDEKIVILGSMNFSRSGESKNDENLVIIEDSEIARFYKNFFEQIWIKIPNKWLYLNARAEGRDSIGSCSDGIDNDFDGKIDKEDSGCN